jgi:hypothetical protein
LASRKSLPASTGAAKLSARFKPARMVWFDGRFHQQMSNWENMGYSCNSLNCDN